MSRREESTGPSMAILAASIVEALEDAGIGVSILRRGDRSPDHVYLNRAAARVLGHPHSQALRTTVNRSRRRRSVRSSRP